MPKFERMNVTQLKHLLVENDLVTTGKKAELIERLKAHLKTDEAEVDDCSSIVQSQIEELRRGMSEILTVVREQNDQRIAEPMVANSTMYQTLAPNNERDHVFQYKVKEIAELLPDFDPTDEQSLSVEQFIDVVESYQTSFDWDDQRLLLAVGKSFKGVARFWLDSTRHLYRTWQELSNAMKSEYGTSLDEAGISHKMRAAVRKDNEKINEYCFRMQALGKRFKLSDAAIVRYTREGLKHHDLQRSIAAMRISSVKELRSICETYFENANVERATTSKTPGRGNNEKPNWKQQQQRGQKEDTKPRFGQVTCYNCDEIGHFSNQCQKPQRRKRCKDCQKVHARGEPENCGRSATVKKTTVKHQQVTFEKDAFINGQLFSAYVDTGSECHMIRESSANLLNCLRTPCHSNLTGLWGGKCVATQEISVNVQLDDVNCDVTLLIVEDNTLTTDLLLGIGIFEYLNADVVNGKMQFKCNGAGQPPKAKPPLQPIGENDIVTGTLERGEVDELLTAINKYRHVFANGMSELGKTCLLEMQIDVTCEKPIAQRPYRIPEPKKKIVKDMIDELLANDIITPSTSDYASPIIMVKKKNGNDRMCVDYRQLNRHTRKEEFPMQNVEESLMKAKQFKFFISLDMNSGFYQIPIAEKSRKFTAFVTSDGIYEFKRMPFGLRNAPAVFQRLMTMLMERFPPDTIFYMDDILIGANTKDELLKKLNKVLEVLDDANLTLNLKKSTFITEQIDFLGHKITPEGYEPGEAKVRAIMEFRQPENQTEIRRFMGLCGFFRKFVQAFARIAEPLNELLRKDVPFVWTERQTKAFEELKRILTSKPVLTGYDINARHEIHSDASKSGLAAVLLQESVDGKLHPVAYFSRSTTESEKVYHSSELEALAVVEALDRFRYYVSGKHVKVVTDCSAITTLTQKKEVIPRIARWWLKIQEFDVEMVHRAGQRMPHVDAMSRAAVEDAREMDVADLQIAKVNINEDDWLYSMQLQDPVLKNIINELNEEKTVDDYKISEGRLFKASNEKLQWVVPKKLRWKVVHDSHVNAGHLSVEKTLDRLKEKFWFARMRNYVKSYMKSCVECAYNKTKGGKTEAEYHFNDIDPVPFKLIHIDHLGPFPKSRKGNEHIIVIIDSFTKFVSLKAVKNTSTKYVIEALRELCSYVGTPNVIVSDRGTAYTSNAFKNYCATNDIKHQQIAVRTPRANGQVERTNRTLLSMLTTMTAEDRLWDEKMRDIQWALNTMKSSSTGRTPQQLLYNFTPRDTLQNHLVLALHDASMITEEELQQQREQAAALMNSKRSKAKIRFDERHQTPKPYEVGDLVLVASDSPSTGTSRKLEQSYKGPYMITKVLGKDRYAVEDLPKSRRTQKRYSAVFAADNMKRWCQLPDEDDDDGSNSSDEDEDVQ